MTNGFTKLFNSIITSSIWSEDDKVRIMWITFLAASDAKGFVSGTIPGMAAIARMSVPEAEQAIRKLESPDPYSRSSKQEGARVIKCNDGWLITNYLKYRKKRDPEKRKKQNRESQRRYREKQNANQSKQNVSQSKPMSAQAEAEADKDIRQKSDDFRLATLLFDLIVTRKPDFRKPDLKKWAVHIDRMIRIDKRETEQIAKVIRWCQADNGNGVPKWQGWQNNILSTEKLREKFDVLELRMQQKSPQTATVPLKRDAEGITPRDKLMEQLR